MSTEYCVLNNVYHINLTEIIDRIITYKRTSLVPKINKDSKDIKEDFKKFLSDYFGDHFDGILSEQSEDVIEEIKMYFKDGLVGGYSSFYCKITWNDSTQENDADLKVFDLLLEIDIQNGADSSKILQNLCHNGAFETVKVRF